MSENEISADVRERADKLIRAVLAMNLTTHRVDMAAQWIAAAEERGRRAGIEERDEMEKALREIESPPWSIATMDPETLCRWMQRRAANAVLALHGALAPRDSGKEST